tara:strand:+ start:498 stop:1157 length:660 start_codon:yes stop_codon:yes gene_type:complete
MNINYETDRLIVLRYPPGGGGKFISLALNLSPDILVQDEKLARLQMKDKFHPMISFDLAMNTFNRKKQTNRHIEYGCNQLANFNAGDLLEDPEADQKLSNDLWKTLTNQTEFYFFMMDQTADDQYKKYKNKKVVSLKNCRWILENRNINASDTNNTGQGILFNMESVQSTDAFYKEIESTLQHLGASIPTKDNLSQQLESLRKNFLEVLSIGFLKKEGK